MKSFVLIISGIVICNLSILSQPTNKTFPTEVSDWVKTSLKTSSDHGFKNPFSGYDDLKNVAFDNCGALIFVAPHDGHLSLSSSSAQKPAEVVVLRAETTNFAAELNSCTAFLLAHKKLNPGESFEASVASNAGLNEAKRFQILKGQTILVFASSSEPTTLDITPEITKVKDLEARAAVEAFEFRKNKAGKSLRIVVRDITTGLPVSVQMNITGLKGIENVYNGSDFTFDLVSGKGAVINCSADGYFNNSVTPKIVPNIDNVITILMTSFSSNKNLRLDGVQFKEGTAEPLPSAFQDLDNLAEFLKNYPNLRIEIQGHVNAPDHSSKAAEKLSLARAKYVRDYLVKSGIHPNRLDYVGYGNTRMIYENPKNEEEEQANRRVEIKIIQ
jgi:outer membrane protein OmpA-like peptidoglycan-associated protein